MLPTKIIPPIIRLLHKQAKIAWLEIIFIYQLLLKEEKKHKELQKSTYNVQKPY